MILMKTSKGDIEIALHDTKTPGTVDNFLSYVRSGFYDNTIFHRVIKGFMIQGGGFSEGMQQKPTQAGIKNEAEVASSNKRGTISMARTSDPHSATAQFFINHADNAFLDYAPGNFGYCVFGEVVNGMDVVDAIAQVTTGHRNGHSDVPQEEVVIYSVAEI